MDMTAVVTCMGRLSHLRFSLPRVMEYTGMRLVVVDYSCPDGSGAWVEANAPEHENERIAVVRSGPRQTFNKPEALNLGLRYAVDHGAEWLCVLDSDTLVTPALWGWLEENVKRGSFYFVEGYKPRQDLSGLIVMHAEDYTASGGYDERFEGWGAEDFDMRCRLYFKLGLPYVEIPCALAESIPHDDHHRVRFYPIKEKQQSHVANQYRLIANVREWTGRDIRELKSDEVRRLFGMRQRPAE